jgi:hypothetical protein
LGAALVLRRRCTFLACFYPEA